MDRIVQHNGVSPPVLHRSILSRRLSAGLSGWSRRSRTSAIRAPPIRAKPSEQGGEPAFVAKDSVSSKLAQKVLTGTLAAALILLPANAGNSMEAFTTSPVSLVSQSVPVGRWHHSGCFVF